MIYAAVYVYFYISNPYLCVFIYFGISLLFSVVSLFFCYYNRSGTLQVV
jgi:hypothetical protein